MKQILGWILKIIAFYLTSMAAPVVSNWLYETLKENFSIPINNLPLVLFLSIAAVIISAVFSEKLISAPKGTSDGKPVKNPPNPEDPFLMGLFISNSFIINIIEIKCLPLNSLLIPENLVQTLLPLLLGGIFTGVLSIERKKYLTANNVKKESQNKKIILQKISEILSKDTRVSQKRLLEECKKNNVILQEFKDYMTVVGMADEYAKIISGMISDIGHSFDGTFSNPIKIKATKPRHIETEHLQKKAVYYFEKYLNDLIIHTMVDYVRLYQSKSKIGNTYRLVTNQPDRWTILRTPDQ